jgi:hypothetical protein
MTERGHGDSYVPSTAQHNTWAWTPAQKRSIYGAFQQIAVFKTEYEKVKE